MKPAIAEVVAPVSDTARRCGVCEQLAHLGYGVRIRQGEEGLWFCAAHRPRGAATSRCPSRIRSSRRALHLNRLFVRAGVIRVLTIARPMGHLRRAKLGGCRATDAYDLVPLGRAVRRWAKSKGGSLYVPDESPQLSRLRPDNERLFFLNISGLGHFGGRGKFASIGAEHCAQWVRFAKIRSIKHSQYA